MGKVEVLEQAGDPAQAEALELVGDPEQVGAPVQAGVLAQAEEEQAEGRGQVEDQELVGEHQTRQQYQSLHSVRYPAHKLSLPRDQEAEVEEVLLFPL